MAIEKLREINIGSFANNQSFLKNWKIYYPFIMAQTAEFKDAKAIFNLGSRLSDIFTLTRIPNQRDNAAVSNAGANWERLVQLYLNIVFSGTHGVCVRLTRATCPSIYRDATSIWYGNNQTNTEADLAVVVFPKDFSFSFNEKNYMSELEKAATATLPMTKFGIVQCKTNWNDNAQIPMLWDIVYRAQHNTNEKMKIGANSVSINNFKNNQITYSFVTVPTQNTKFNSNTMAVKRVSALSGGNFWGKSTQRGVAQSLSEIFNRNFSEAFDGNMVVTSIENALANGHLDWIHKIGLDKS